MWSRSYDPFGGIYGESGSQPSLGFQHQYTDPGTGATNMGSRWYNRHTGTFASRDTAGLDPRDTLNANRYAYAGGSPLNYTDPDGKAVLAVCAVPVVAPVCAKGAAKVGAAAAAWGPRLLKTTAALLRTTKTLPRRLRVSNLSKPVRDGWSGGLGGRIGPGPNRPAPPGPPPPTPPRPPAPSPSDLGGGWSAPDNGGGGGGGVSAAAAAAAAEAARLLYWAGIVTERANTPAAPPKPTVTVGQASKALWDAVNNLTNAIKLGVLGGEGNDSDEPVYVPDAVEAGPTGQLAPAQGYLADSCVSGGHARSDGSRSGQVWACGAGEVDKATGLPVQLHHFATNKSKTYTPRMQKIADRYGLSLDDSWNTEMLPHRGRHPNDYHDWVHDEMVRASRSAGDDPELFKRLFDQYVKQPVRNNPLMLRKEGWP